MENFWTETLKSSSFPRHFQHFLLPRKREQKAGLEELFSNCVTLLNHTSEEEVYHLWTSKNKVCLLKQNVNLWESMMAGSLQNTTSTAAFLIPSRPTTQHEFSNCLVRLNRTTRAFFHSIIYTSSYGRIHRENVGLGRAWAYQSNWVWAQAGARLAPGDMKTVWRALDPQGEPWCAGTAGEAWEHTHSEVKLLVMVALLKPCEEMTFQSSLVSPAY